MTGPDAARTALAGTIGLIPVLGVLAPQGMLVLLAAAAMALLAQPGWRTRWPRRTAAGFALLLVWALVTCLWTPEGGSALRRLAMLALECAAGLVAVAGMLGMDRDLRERSCRYLLAGLLAALAILAAEIATGGALQALLASRRPNLMEAYNRGGTVLAIFLWPAVAWLAAQGGRGRLAGCVLVGAVALVLAGLEGRAAQLALAIGAVTYVATLWRPRFFAALLVAGVAVALAAMPLLVTALPTAEEAAADGLPFGPSALHRLVIWDFSTGRIAERPGFGWGFDAARHLDSPVRPVVLDVPPGPERPAIRHEFPGRLPLHPHNMALQIWLELGLIGLLGAGLALAPGLGGLVARAGSRPAAPAAMLAAAATVAFLAYGAWQGWWISALWLAAAIAAAGRRQEGAETA